MIWTVEKNYLGPFYSHYNLLRQYLRGFGEAILRAFESHLSSSPGRRDLRFKPQIHVGASPLEQFNGIPMGDLWEDANLAEPFTYLMTSKKVRTGIGGFFFESSPWVTIGRGAINKSIWKVYNLRYVWGSTSSPPVCWKWAVST